MKKSAWPEASPPDLKTNNKILLFSLAVVSSLVIIGVAFSPICGSQCNLHFAQTIVLSPQAEDMSAKTQVLSDSTMSKAHIHERALLRRREQEDILATAYFLNTPGPMGSKRESWIRSAFEETMPRLALRKHSTAPLSDPRINTAFRLDQQQVL